MVSQRNASGVQELIVEKGALTPAVYSDLTEIPHELEWPANITHPKNRETVGET